MRTARRIIMGAAPLAAAAAWLGTAAPAAAETVAIIGTGNVAHALGPAFAASGHEIVYGSRNPDRDSVDALIAMTGNGARAVAQSEAADGADVVVLAVPWDVVESVVDNLGDLAGRVIIDPTNPYAAAEDGLRDYALESSNAERIQKLAPEAHVVKAFNTMTAQLMANPGRASGPVTVPIAGNDADAKAVVAGLAEDIGFMAMDLGPVRYAHVIEGMFLVWANARQSGDPFEYYLRPPERD